MTNLVSNFIKLEIMSQPTNRLWIEIIGVDVAAFLSSGDCEWADSRKHVIQDVTSRHTFNNALVFRCYRIQQ